MHVIIVTPEVSPYSGAGDLAELCSFLPAALAPKGARITVITPFYQGIDPSRHGLARRLLRIPVKVGGEQLEVGLIDGKFQAADVSLLLVDHPESFDREGLYGDAKGPFKDNARRYYIFCAAVAEMLRELDLKPDLVHAAGWQTGFLPQILASQDHTKDLPVLFTIHDEEAQGAVPAATLKELGVEDQGLARNGEVSLLELGASQASMVLGRSPAHARWLAQTESGSLYQLFAGLGDRLAGILPGVEASMWDPGRNHRLPHKFDAGDLTGKADCKMELQRELGLTVDGDLPLLVMTAPLELEAGLDMVLGCATAFPPAGKYQLVLAGALDEADATVLGTVVAANPGEVLHQSKIEDTDLHRLLAGADGLLMPQRRELSILMLLKAMRYGVVPLTRDVGALRDAVVNFDELTGTGTGVTFTGEDPADYLAALQRFITLLANAGRRATLTRNVMSHAFTWDRAADLYLELYEGLQSKNL